MTNRHSNHENQGLLPPALEGRCLPNVAARAKLGPQRPAFASLALLAIIVLVAGLTHAAEFATVKDCIRAFSTTPKGEPPEALHYRSVNELVRRKEASVRPLSRALSSKDKRVRQYAILALGRIRSQRAFRSLLEAMKDSDRDVRAAAAEAIGLLGDVRALKPLTQFLASEDEIIVRGGIVGLGRLGDNRAVPSLLPLLASENWEIRWRTALALGHIGEMDTWTKLGPLARDEAAVVRGAACWALGAIAGQPDLSEFGKNLKSRDGGIIYGSAWAVGVIGSNDAAELLQTMASAGNPTAREACTLVLRWMGREPGTVPESTGGDGNNGPKLASLDLEERWLDRYNKLTVSATESFELALPEGIVPAAAAPVWLLPTPGAGILMTITCENGDVHTLRSTNQGRTWKGGLPDLPGRVDAGVATGENVYAFDKHAFRREGIRYVTRLWTSADGGATFAPAELAAIECGQALRTERMSSPALNNFKKTSARWSERFFHGLTGRVLDLGDGLLLTTTQGRLEFDTEPRTFSFRSEDGGRVWSRMATVMGEGVVSPSLARCPDGNLACLARDAGTGDLLLAWSVDQGKSWWEPIRTGSKGKCPTMIDLKDGILACSYAAEGARIMFDATGTGRRWTDRVHLITDAEEVVAAATLCEIGNGRLLYAYTATEANGSTDKTALRALYVTVAKVQE